MKYLVKWNNDLPKIIEVGDTLDFSSEEGVVESYAVLGINEDGIIVKKLEVSNDKN